jgi:hypothetical protein
LLGDGHEQVLIDHRRRADEIAGEQCHTDDQRNADGADADAVGDADVASRFGLADLKRRDVGRLMPAA